MSNFAILNCCYILKVREKASPGSRRNTMRRRLILILLLLSINVPVQILAKSDDSSEIPVAPLVTPTDEEKDLMRLANRERGRRGLSRLRTDSLLIEVARLHSAEMRDLDYFNHESPTEGLKTPMDRYMKAVSPPPAYACVGENLFWCTEISVERGHRAFMDSPAHRGNVLFPRFEKIGVGIVKNERGEFWVTQLFLSNTDPAPPSQAKAN